jgi:hypothetical protein
MCSHGDSSRGAASSGDDRDQPSGGSGLADDIAGCVGVDDLIYGFVHPCNLPAACAAGFVAISVAEASMPHTEASMPHAEASLPYIEASVPTADALPPDDEEDCYIEEYLGGEEGLATDSEAGMPEAVASLPAEPPMEEPPPEDVEISDAEASMPQSAAELADMYWTRACQGRGSAVRARARAASAGLGKPGGLAIGASRGKGDAAKGKGKSGGKPSKGHGSKGKVKGSAQKAKSGKNRSLLPNPDDDVEGDGGSAASRP